LHRPSLPSQPPVTASEPWCPGGRYVFLGPEQGHFRRSNHSGHELRAWPGAEKQRYAGEHQGGWAGYLDRLATLLAKRQPG
jgi:hypothetical protein